MSRDQNVLTTLRSLDAADTDIDPQSPRARADLVRIMASDAPPPARRSRTRWKFVVAGGVATAAAAMVLLPSMTGGDPAFATWKPSPEGMTPQARVKAAAACRESLSDGPGREHATELAEAEPAVVDRRGVWTTVVLAGKGGSRFSAMCITDGSAGMFDTGFGSAGIRSGAAPGPRDLVTTDFGMGVINSHELSLAVGEAGSQVKKVVYDSRTRGKVTATVAKGRFALWLPGDELRDPRGGVQAKVTYKDGSTGTVRLGV